MCNIDKWKTAYFHSVQPNGFSSSYFSNNIFWQNSKKTINNFVWKRLLLKNFGDKTKQKQTNKKSGCLVVDGKNQS